MLQQLNINFKEILKIVFFIIGTILGIYLFYRLAPYIAPFILAYLISSAMEPTIKLLTYRLKIPRKISALITLLFVLFTFGTLIVFITSRIISEFTSVAQTLPAHLTDAYININLIIERGTNIYHGLGLPEQITRSFEGMLSSISGSVINVVNNMVKGILNTAISIPEAIIFTLVTILSTFFLASDRDMIYAYVRHQFPDSWVEKIRTIRDDMFSAMFGYIRAQLIIMTITFTELCIGFNVIGITHPFLLSFVVSLVDALPILGTGSILIPWAAYNLLTGNIPMAIALLVIYGIALAVRQMTEPKIVSQQIGIYPLVTLIAMYTGLKLLGFFGLILGPATMLLLKNILSGAFKIGIIKEIIRRTQGPGVNE